MSIRPIDLRDILDYVPRFRNHTFVLSVDGSVISDPNFKSILTDIAVLHSLGIQIVFCYGVAHQIREIAAQKQLSYTDDRGEGPTDVQTLQLAIEATGKASAIIMKGLSEKDLPFSITNAISARPQGIVAGVDQQSTGICEKINTARINRLLQQGDIPVFSPIVYDNKGRSLRLNSDHIAAKLSTELKASKLIYLSSRSRLMVDNESILNCSAEALGQMIRQHPQSIDPLLLSKAKHAIDVLSWNTERVHILDGRIDGCLLIEIFDKVGLGTMIHTNEYDRIRKAQREDLADIYTLVKQASKTSSLVNRTMEEVEQQLQHYYVYEVDASIIGCTCLIPHTEQLAELASVCVQPYHQGKGIGQKLAQYTVEQAQTIGYRKLIALSTQASEFFTEHLGFSPASVNDLPPNRRQHYTDNKRNSIVLMKEFL